MAPTRDLPAHEPAATVAWAELVVQNGRVSGTSWPLQAACHTVGRQEGCDLRLNAAGVSPLHCVLFRGPAGPVVSDLQSEDGTLVNDEPVATCALRDGDRLCVGPFEFVIRFTPPPERTARDALRVQVAAVAAQQAALTEEEMRLRQQRRALEQQEAQLAAHLDEKRQRLIELRDQARQAFAELRDERARYEKYVGTAVRELTAGRAELADGRKQLQSERQRLWQLRRRLRQRAHRHWLAERTRLHQRGEELAQEREQLQREREELLRGRLRLNGDLELGRRQLQAAREELEMDQRLWAERHAQEQEALAGVRRQLDRRAAELAEAARTWEEEQRRCESECRRLRQEAEGLENRIRNQRPLLMTRPAVASPPVAAPAWPSQRQRQVQEVENELLDRLAAVERLADDLADQRRHLAEQCEQLEAARLQWQIERAAAAAELEPLASRLEQREQALATDEAQLRQRQEDIIRLRQYLAAWQAHLESRTAAWDAERERLLATLRSWEEGEAKQSADEDSPRLQRQLRFLEAQGEIYQQQIRELNEAVERLACGMLDGPSSPSLQAA